MDDIEKYLRVGIISVLVFILLLFVLLWLFAPYLAKEEGCSTEVIGLRQGQLCCEGEECTFTYSLKWYEAEKFIEDNRWGSV